MALTRRGFLLGVPATGALVACGAGTGAAPGAGYRELFKQAPPRGAARSVLAFMPETAQTKEVWRGMSDELRNDFELVAVEVNGADAAHTIARGIERYRPSALVLMNNPTVSAYREYQRATPGRHFAPAVIVMSSFLDRHPEGLSATTGISYEVPLITVVTNLRKLIATPIDRVGVIRRHALAGFIDRQAALARTEQTEVVVETVSQRPNASEIKRALRRLKQRVNALWVPNDDHLLSPELIGDGWLPGLNERPFVPTIVGVASLVSPQHSFGTFAVLPDHTALGVQAASIVFDIADNSWVLPTTEPQLPVSTTTTIDLPQVVERFALREGALAQVDRVVEH
jgi:hypothetical protein